MTITADGVTDDRSDHRPDRPGHGDRLRRHLRRERPDPDQPPRRRGQPPEADGHAQGRPHVPRLRLRHRHPHRPRHRQGRCDRPADRPDRRLVDHPGRPAGVRHRQPARHFTDSVTSGIISALGRSIDVEGGSLDQPDPDRHGDQPRQQRRPAARPVRARSSASTPPVAGSQGIGFAIPINIARPLLTQASAGQPLARPISASASRPSIRPSRSPTTSPSTTAPGSPTPRRSRTAARAPTPTRRTRTPRGRTRTRSRASSIRTRAARPRSTRRPPPRRSSPAARPTRPASRRATSSPRSTARRSTPSTRSTS